MTKDQIKQHLQADPFRPFRMRTRTGEFFDVSHPRLTIVTKSGSIYVYRPTEEADVYDFLGIVSAQHVESIEYVDPAPSHGNGAA
ncbi:MAG: hypothetical protein AAF288_06450 [Planctomycetota bacterium]